MNNPILDWGIQFILRLQAMGDPFLAVMQFFTFLGSEQFFLMVMPALYWCVDAALGIRVGVMLMISNGLNGVLKLVFQGPRPFFYSPEVKALTSETSFGIPSGHSQNSAAMFGLIAASLRRGWVWALCLAFVFLIGLSRLALGVHFQTDVLLGWAAGFALVWGFMRLEPWVKASLSRQSFPAQVGWMLAASIMLWLPAALVRTSLSAWTIPAGWLSTAAITNPGGALPDPLAQSGNFTVAGSFFGLAVGALWLFRRGGFDARGPLVQRGLRFVIGLVGVLLFWQGLGALLPDGEAFVPYLLRFLRYTLVGLWMSAGAPLVFLRLGLARPASEAVTPLAPAAADASPRPG